MASKVINFKFTGATTPVSSYDSTKINLPSMIYKYTGGATTDKYVSPAILGLARPMEQTTSIPSGATSVLSNTNDMDWVFASDGASAAATRRIMMYEYTKSTSAFVWKGFITLTFPTATNHTIRGFNMVRNLYTTGTVAVSGTAVTGTGTAFQTSKLSVGTRIGFGNTDPKQISAWYEIAAIGSDTSITLTASAGTIGAGASFVIDDIVATVQTTNATTTNGGLFLVKGISPEMFIPTGTSVAAATTGDNIRAVYWLADASTVTNTISGGVAVDTIISWTDQRVYVIDTSAKIYVYNIRNALTLTSGKDTTSLVLVTGVQTVTGTISQNQNGIIATLSHGPGSGVKSMYFATTTRLYRAAVSGITSSSTTWQSDSMIEVPPGGTVTFAASAAMSHVRYISDLDKLVIGTSNDRSYLTAYNTSSTAFDYIFLNDDKQLDISTASASTYKKPATQGLVINYTYHEGILFLNRVSTSNTANQIYTLPLLADKKTIATSSQYLITPKFDVSDANNLYNVYINSLKSLGTAPFQIPLEPFDVYYRTTGISDNTGSWTLIDGSGDISGVSGTEIQFAIAFQVIGGYCVPARILGLALSYEDLSTDSHYEPSVGKSVIASNRFAFRQRTAWGTDIPNLRIRLINAVTTTTIIDDDVLTSASGTWEYSTDGTIWNAWDDTQDTIGYYIRYTATSLPDTTKIRVLLTQA